LDRKFNFKDNQLTAAFRGLINPSDQINQLSQRIDILNEKIEKNVQNILSNKQQKLASLFQRLPTPIQKLGDIQTRIIAANERMRAQIDKKLSNSEQTILRYEQLLNAFSFKRVLEKGFVLVTDLDGNPIKQSQDAATGALINLQFFDATRHAQLDPEKISDGSAKANASRQNQTQPKKVSADDNAKTTQPKLF
jgi:exodeoxyribonuclease VII large subunit